MIKWALNRQDQPPPEPYLSWLAGLMPETHRVGMGYWIGCVAPNSPLDGDWVKGYPHCHVNSVKWSPDTLTITTFLIIPESGGEFALGGNKETDPYTLIAPKLGLSIVNDAVRWHGVKPVTSGTRMSLMTSSPPDGE